MYGIRDNCMFVLKGGDLLLICKMLTRSQLLDNFVLGTVKKYLLRVKNVCSYRNRYF